MADAAPPVPEKPLCFVIGPIGARASDIRKHADWMLHGIIKPTLEDPEFGYRVKRADEDADPGMINNAMILDITGADLVVADLTDLNPNAFYELGITHAAEKPVIHIAKAGTVIPFDNAGQRTIDVDITDFVSVQEAKRRLADMARAIKKPDYKVSNPITQANASFRMRESADPIERVLGEVLSRLDRIESNSRPPPPTRPASPPGVNPLLYTANPLSGGPRNELLALARQLGLPAVHQNPLQSTRPATKQNNRDD